MAFNPDCPVPDDLTVGELISRGLASELRRMADMLSRDHKPMRNVVTTIDTVAGVARFKVRVVDLEVTLEMSAARLEKACRPGVDDG